jgi:hypothetical protein
MQAPTATQVRTAIEVLEKLGERINEHAARSVRQIPPSHAAGQLVSQISASATEQNNRVKAITGLLQTWHTNWNVIGGKMFQCNGNTGHAQPRAGAWSRRCAQLRTLLQICVAICDDNAAKATAHNANRSCEHIRQSWRYLSAARMVRRDCIGAAFGAARTATHLLPSL